MWSPDNPPPAGLNLHIHVSCPECGQDLSFKSGGLGQHEKDSIYKEIYCRNEQCQMFMVFYWLLLTSRECRVASELEIPR
jgi:hypothetical protein